VEPSPDPGGRKKGLNERITLKEGERTGMADEEQTQTNKVIGPQLNKGIPQSSPLASELKRVGGGKCALSAECGISVTRELRKTREKEINKNSSRKREFKREPVPEQNSLSIVAPTPTKRKSAEMREKKKKKKEKKGANITGVLGKGDWEALAGSQLKVGSEPDKRGRKLECKEQPG